MNTISNDLRERALTEVTAYYTNQGLTPERAFSEEMLDGALKLAKTHIGGVPGTRAHDSVGLTERQAAFKQRAVERQEGYAREWRKDQREREEDEREGGERYRARFFLLLLLLLLTASPL